MNDADLRYAVYLIPPYPVAQPVVEIHHMLRKQFGFVAADRFQAHVTLKGFFKMRLGPPQALATQLDHIFAGRKPFPVQIGGYRIDDIGIGLNVSLIDGAPNAPLMTVREEIVDVVRPAIAPDCDFVTADLGNPFAGHLTLAFRDIPVEMQTDVLAYLADAPVPSVPFMAKTFHYLVFHSQNWAGPWWETLTWRLLKSWYLGD